MRAEKGQSTVVRVARATSLLVFTLVLACAGLPVSAWAEQAGSEEGFGLSVAGDDSSEGGEDLHVLSDGAATGLADDGVVLGDEELGDGIVEEPDAGIVDTGGAIASQSDGGEQPLEAQAAAAHVSYRTHVQSFGWQASVRDGEVSGTSGQAKRLEGIELRLAGASYSGGITYRTHVQGVGWQAWRSNGQMAGTSGQARRLEAIEIKLTGAMASKYDVWYRVHAQSYGWMGWAKNGARAGTATMGKRLEAIQVLLHPKGSAAPPNTYRGIARAYAPAYATRYVQYRTHVQSFGWQGWSYDGQMAGTSGQSKRLEGVEVRLADPFYTGSIQYRTHVQGIGWQGWVSDGRMAGTSGQARRLEAIQIRLTGTMASKYDVWYRVHAQIFGWMGWAKNGASAGTEGYAKRLEAIEILVKAKGAAAPGSTANAFRKPSVVSASYESVYGPILRSAASEARSIKSPGPKYQYFLYDIDHNGVMEMIVGDKAVGGSTGSVYTIVGDGGKLSTISLGVTGTGFRDSYRVNGEKFYRSHQYAGKVYVDYLVTVSGRTVIERQIGGITQGGPGVSGTLISGYNIYTSNGYDYKPSIDYSGLRRAGNVKLLV